MGFALGVGGLVAAVVLVFFLIERRRSKTGFYGTKASEQRVPPILGAAGFGGVFLETDAGNVLVLLPVSEDAPDPTPSTDDLVTRTDAVVVVNDPARLGRLRTSLALEVLGLGDVPVYATDANAPVDRRANGQADTERNPPAVEPLGTLERGRLKVKALDPHTLYATWEDHGAPWQATIGTDLLLEPKLPSRTSPNFLVGSIQFPTETEEALWLAGAITALHEVMYLRHCELGGENAQNRVIQMFEDSVVPHVVVGEIAWIVQGMTVARELRDGNEALARAAVEAMTPRGLEQSLTAFAARGDESGLRFAEIAIETHPDVGALHFQLGVIQTMGAATAEDPEAAYAQAEASLQAALEAELPFSIAGINLAGLRLRRGDPEAARAAIDTALEAHPSDALCVRAAVVVRAHAGDLEGAKALLEASHPVLDPLVFGQLRIALDEGLPPSDHTPHFPMHAALMSELGWSECDTERWPEAVVAFRRAVELDPTALSAHAGLGYALSASGDDLAALEHYDAVIPTLPGGDLLRFNRGNVYLLVKRIDEAIEEFEFCLDLRPDWIEARIDLFTALTLGKYKRQALKELDRLEEDERMDDLIFASLEDQFRETFR